jgi:glycosyltransferase involved in cell wall biosynthesis
MRLLIAGAHRAIRGGAESYQRNLIPVLLSRGHEVALLHEFASGPEDETVDPSEANVPCWCAGDLGVDGALRHVARWRPDVAYVQGLESPDLEETILNRHPAALFAHSYHGTCATGTKRHAFPRVRMCTRRFGPMCLVLHYPRRCGGLSPVTAVSTYRVQARRNNVLVRYGAVLVASKHMYAEYARHSVPADRLYLAPLPASGITPDPQPPTPRPPTGRVLLMGRLTDLKGGEHLIRALPLASRALDRALELTVVGSGPARHYLEELSRELGVQAQFTGWVKCATRNELFRTADLLVMPSLWPEPFGLLGIEAACRGLPAVGYAVGGIADWLIPGESGELARGDPPTHGGLAQAIIRALHDSAHYARLRRGAWEMARRFSMEAHLTILEGALERVIAERAPSA